MTAFEALPSVTLHVTVGDPFRPPGTCSPYDAIKPAWVNWRTAMARAPAIKRRRRGRRSMNISAGSVMITLMTYWILADSRALLPVSPAIYMHVSLAANFQGSKRRREADLKDVDNVVHHGIRSTELRPNMSEYTTMNSNNIPRVKDFHPGSTLILTFKPWDLLVGEARNRYLLWDSLNLLTYFRSLCYDDWIQTISLCVQAREDLDCFFPPVLGG